MGVRCEANGRLWVFSEIYYPEETSTGFILTGIAEGLARGEGSQVEVITGPGRLTLARRRHEEHNGVTIHRVGRATRWRTGFVSRLVHGVLLSVRMAWEGRRRLRQGDVALVVTNPPLLPLLVAWVCRLRRVPYVVLVHDVYPHAMASMGVLKRNSFAFRAAVRVQRKILGGAERVVVLGRRMAELVATDFLVEPRRVREIPNWADTDLVSPDPEAGRTFRAETGIREPFVVLHAGNMGRTHDVSVLLDAADRLRGEGVRFLFIGSGARSDLVRRRADEPGSNVTLMPPMPRSVQREFLNAGHVSVMAFEPDMGGVSVPSRLYNILAAGRPAILVGGEGSETARILEDEGVGWVVPTGAVEELVSTLYRARNEAALRAEMGRRARRLAETRYARKVVLDRWREEVGELLGGVTRASSAEASEIDSHADAGRAGVHPASEEGVA